MTQKGGSQHTLNIDFINEAAGPAARVAVELSPESARELVARISAVLQAAENRLFEPAAAAE